MSPCSSGCSRIHYVDKAGLEHREIHVCHHAWLCCTFEGTESPAAVGWARLRPQSCLSKLNNLSSHPAFTGEHERKDRGKEKKTLVLTLLEEKNSI